MISDAPGSIAAKGEPAGQIIITDDVAHGDKRGIRDLDLVQGRHLIRSEVVFGQINGEAFRLSRSGSSGRRFGGCCACFATTG